MVSKGLWSYRDESRAARIAILPTVGRDHECSYLPCINTHLRCIVVLRLARYLVVLLPPQLDLRPSEMESSNHWQTIRPWTNRISLQVKELTSISATFLLTSVSPGLDTTLSSSDEPQPSHANPAQAPTPTHLPRSLREVLRRGLAVKVNGVPWPKVVPHIEDDDSEAIIILYGFLPARTYDIELSIAPDEEPLRKQIATRQGIMIGSPPHQAIYSLSCRYTV